MTSLSGPIKRTRVGAPATGFLDRSVASANDARRYALSQQRACFHRRFGRWKMRTRFRFAVAIAIAMLTTGYARSASNQDAIPVPPPNPFRTAAPAPSPSNIAVPAEPVDRNGAKPIQYRGSGRPIQGRGSRRTHPRPPLRRRTHPKPKLRQRTTTTPRPGSGRRPTIKAVPELGFCSSRRTGFIKGGSSRGSNSRENNS